MGIGHWAGVLPRRDETCDVRHVDHEICPDGVRDLAHALEIYKARVRARTGDDELRTALLGALLHLVVIDSLRLRIDAGEAGLKYLPEMDALEPWVR